MLTSSDVSIAHWLFGPCWGIGIRTESYIAWMVTNACRLFGACSGHKANSYYYADYVHQCLSAVRSLFGQLTLGKLLLFTGVTNACRLFGPCWDGGMIDETSSQLTGHQCLSAVRSLLGLSLKLTQLESRELVTNACRLFGPCWVP